MKYGLVDLNEIPVYNKENKPRKQGNGKDMWLRLDQGDNELRVLTDFYQYNFHRYKMEGEKGLGKRIYCSGVNGNPCPLCNLKEVDEKGEEKMKYKLESRWYVGVIERKHGTYKIMDMSKSVVDALVLFNKNPRIGSPKDYDINVVVNKNAPPAKYYSVNRYDKEPLSEEDVNIKKSQVDPEWFHRKCTPPTPEQVAQRMKEHEVKFAGESPSQQTQAKQETTQQEVPASTQGQSAVEESSEDDFTFPPAQV